MCSAKWNLLPCWHEAPFGGSKSVFDSFWIVQLTFCLIEIMLLVWNRNCRPLCLGLKASVPPTRSGRSCSLSRASCSPCQMGMVTLTWSWWGGCRRLWNTQYHVGHTEYLGTKIETPNVEILSFQIESDSQLLSICQDGAWFLGRGSWVLGPGSWGGFGRQDHCLAGEINLGGYGPNYEWLLTKVSWEAAGRASVQLLDGSPEQGWCVWRCSIFWVRLPTLSTTQATVGSRAEHGQPAGTVVSYRNRRYLPGMTGTEDPPVAVSFTILDTEKWEKRRSCFWSMILTWFSTAAFASICSMCIFSSEDVLVTFSSKEYFH